MERRTAALLAGVFLLSSSVVSGNPQSDQPLVARGSNVYGAGAGFIDETNIVIEEHNRPLRPGEQGQPPFPGGRQVTSPPAPVSVPDQQQPRPQAPLPLSSQGRNPQPGAGQPPPVSPGRPLGLDQIDLRISDLTSTGNNDQRPPVLSNQLGPVATGQFRPPQSRVVGSAGQTPAPSLPGIDNALTGLAALPGPGSLGPGASGRDTEFVLGFERNSAQAGGEADAIPAPASRTGSGVGLQQPGQARGPSNAPQQYSQPLAGAVGPQQRPAQFGLQPSPQQSPQFSQQQSPPSRAQPAAQQAPKPSSQQPQLPAPQPPQATPSTVAQLAGQSVPASQVVRGGTTYGLGSDNAVPAPPSSVPSGNLNIQPEQPNTKFDVLSQAALPDEEESSNLPPPVVGQPGPIARIDIKSQESVASQPAAPLRNAPTAAPPAPPIAPAPTSRPTRRPNNGEGHHMGGIEWLPESIPGQPLVDYPVLSQIPETGFDCSNLDYDGFFADTASSARCQVFWVCHRQQQDGFLCPNGTIFHQRYFTCDWWFNVDCEQSADFYELNRNIGVVGTHIDTQPAGVVAAASKVHPVFTLLSEMLHFPRVPPVRPQNRTKPAQLPVSVSEPPVKFQTKIEIIQDTPFHAFSGAGLRSSDKLKRSNINISPKLMPERHEERSTHRHRKHARRRGERGRHARHLQHHYRHFKHRRSPADAAPAAAVPVGPAPPESNPAPNAPNAPAPPPAAPGTPSSGTQGESPMASGNQGVLNVTQPDATDQVIELDTTLEIPMGQNGQPQAPTLREDVKVMEGNNETFSSDEKVVPPGPGAALEINPPSQITWGQQSQIPGETLKTGEGTSQGQPGGLQSPVSAGGAVPSSGAASSQPETLGQIPPPTGLPNPPRVAGSTLPPGVPAQPLPPAQGQPAAPSLPGPPILQPAPGQRVSPLPPGQPGVQPAGQGQSPATAAPAQPTQPPAPGQPAQPQTHGQPSQSPIPGRPPISVQSPAAGQLAASASTGQPMSSSGQRQQISPQPPGQALNTPAPGQPQNSPSPTQPPNVPPPGQPLNAPSVGQPPNAPSPGQSPDAPSPGQPPNAPSPGQSPDAPSPGQPPNAPSPGQSTDAPSPGQPPNAPSPGQSTDAPSPGQPLNAPSSGQSPDAPSLGQPLNAPSSGQSPDATSSGQPPDTQSPGKSASAPMSEQPSPAPPQGQRVSPSDQGQNARLGASGLAASAGRPPPAAPVALAPINPAPGQPASAQLGLSSQNGQQAPAQSTPSPTGPAGAGVPSLQPPVPGPEVNASSDSVAINIEVDEGNEPPVKEVMHYPPLSGDGVQNQTHPVQGAAGSPIPANPNQPIIDTTFEFERGTEAPIGESYEYSSGNLTKFGRASASDPMGKSNLQNQHNFLQANDPSALHHDMPSAIMGPPEQQSTSVKNKGASREAGVGKARPGEIQITSESLSKIIRHPKRAKKVRDPAGFSQPKSISSKLDKKFSSSQGSKNENERSLSVKDAKPSQSKRRAQNEPDQEEIEIDEKVEAVKASDQSKSKEPEEIEISEKIETVEEDDNSDEGSGTSVKVEGNVESGVDSGSSGGETKSFNMHAADSGWKKLSGPMGMNVRVYVSQVPIDGSKGGETASGSDGDEPAKNRRQIQPDIADDGSLKEVQDSYDYDFATLPFWMKRIARRRVNREHHPIMLQNVLPDYASVPDPSIHRSDPVARSIPRIQHSSVSREKAYKRSAPEVIQTARENLMNVLGGPKEVLDNDIDHIVEDTPSDKDKRDNELKLRFDPNRLTSYSDHESSWF